MELWERSSSCCLCNVSSAGLLTPQAFIHVSQEMQIREERGRGSCRGKFEKHDLRGAEAGPSSGAHEKDSTKRKGPSMPEALLLTANTSNETPMGRGVY